MQHATSPTHPAPPIARFDRATLLGFYQRMTLLRRFELKVQEMGRSGKIGFLHLYIGQALYQVGTKDVPGWRKPGELPAHLAINRKYPQIRGDVYFSASSLLRDPLSAMSTITKVYYRRPALLPLSPLAATT